MTNDKMVNSGIGKRGQITIFIIIAIVVVGIVLAFFLLKGKEDMGIPKELAPVYNYFLSCVDEETKFAASLMGVQAGYLELPEFSPGSEYMPFSSHLDFLGAAVPYWYYVSGNGIVKEQIPSKEKMESQLEDYLEERLKECDFSDFREQGIVVERGEPEVIIDIEENKIDVDVKMILNADFEENYARKENHKVAVDSKLGKFYNIAREIYDKENSDLFLENYGVDVLRLYAPVTDVEISCSPKIWLQDEIKEELKDALEANTQALKIKGNYYSLAEDSGYFVQDIGYNLRESVNFIYAKNWPTKIEIYAEDPMIAEPVGLEEGLGVLGFCYVPYHFVYDIYYPVLIQVYDTEELFQFPVAVLIDKNKPKRGEDVGVISEVVPELCKYKLKEVSVYTYNTYLEPVEADIDFKCFDTKCDIGRTNVEKSGRLSALFPQCVNGFVIAEADGYVTKKEMISTVNGGTIDLVLDRLYELNLDITLEGEPLEDDMAVVQFSGENSFSVAYPEQKKIEISEGEYDISVYVYKNTSLSLAGFDTKKCIEVPKSGISGVFGGTKEKCFNLEVPAQTISFAVAGGGKSGHYFVESELAASNHLEIHASKLPIPVSIEQLQDNYALLEEKNLGFDLI